MQSKKGGKLNNDWSLGLMTIEHIQDLIVNAARQQLGRGASRTLVSEALHQKD